MKYSKIIKFIRLCVTILGITVSWYATIRNFINFYNIEGTIFKIKDCVIPNPVVTPCFWGALAFLLSAFWAYRLYRKTDKKKERNFLIFMICCVIFAWSNFAIELNGVKPAAGVLIAPCPANVSGPFLSPCFFGSILFSVSFLISLFLYLSLRSTLRKA